MTRLTGKKAVISGGTHGMGFATARALLDAGAEVIVTGRDEKNLEAARNELGDGAHVLSCDVTRIADLDSLAEQVRSTFGEIDLLHVNAGYAKLEPYDVVTEEAYDRTFDVNTKGAFFTAQRLAPAIREGGSIVFTTSVANARGVPNMSVYGAAKAAVRSYAMIFAAELNPRGIRVNAVAPGFIETPSMGIDAPADFRDEFMEMGDSMTPMHRHGTPEEVASTVLYLAFDATFMTGQELAVDGGLITLLG